MSREPWRCSGGAEEMADGLERDALRAWAKPPRRLVSPVVDLIRSRVHDESPTIARVTGVLFLITFSPRSPPTFSTSPCWTIPATSSVAAPTASVSLGAFLELMLIIANIGTAVVLYPVVKRVNEILALGYVTAVSSNAPSSPWAS
jgi:hypothetical protein